MPYQSKAERHAASLMTWSMLIEHVRFRSVERCDENEARRQIGNAIAGRKLHVRWEDQAKIPFGSGPIQVQVSTPPLDATYWLKCEIDPTDPDRVREPPPYDSDLVDKRTAKRLDKTRRFRQPLFPRDQVLKLWPLLPPSGPSDATVVNLESRRRGPKPEVLNRVKETMRSNLRSLALTKKELDELSEEAMRARYDASRDTCRNAREQVLSESEFVDNLPDGNSDK